jgi:APA family basic amino acid/polyamine antiporter
LQKLGFIGALSLVVGNIIGVGIFTTTGYITQYLYSPALIMLAWFLGALYAYSGAGVYSILAAEYPFSGGDYQYLRKAVHPLAGYLFGWSAFFVTYSGSIAALGIAAAYYLNGALNLSGFDTVYSLFYIAGINITLSQSKIFAIIFILIFSWVSYRGILLSGKFQIVLTAAIFIFLVLFSITGLISPSTDFSVLFMEGSATTELSGFLTSLIAVIFSYIGWTTAVYVAEEIKEAKKNIPTALRFGVLLVGTIYILINIVYLTSIPINEMSGVINIATVVFSELWGKNSGVLASIIILVAVLSSLNSTVLSGPRIYMAMGREGFFLELTKDLHPRFHSPHRAIFLQALWSVCLVLSGSFNQLLSFVIFVIVSFSFMAALISIRILNRNQQCTFSKVIGIGFYSVFCLTIMINTLIESPVESFIGIVLVIIALPFYYMEKRRHAKMDTI